MFYSYEIEKETTQVVATYFSYPPSDTIWKAYLSDENLTPEERKEVREFSLDHSVDIVFRNAVDEEIIIDTVEEVEGFGPIKVKHVREFVINTEPHEYSFNTEDKEGA